MKATVLYCDRCIGEGKETVPAPLIVWIRTGGMPHALRLDVCLTHYAAITGQTNGAAPTPPAPTPEVAVLGVLGFSRRGGSGKYQKRLEQILAYTEKHPRFTLDQLRLHFGKDFIVHQFAAPLKMLVEHRKLERYMQGVYQRPGYTIPEPPTKKDAAAQVMKLIRANPGMRGLGAAAMAGVASEKLWKPTLDYMREQKLIKTKGTKSAMRLYPA